MNGKDAIRKLATDTIGAAFKEENHPLLIACLKKDIDYHMHLKQLEEVATFFRDSISVCFILDDLYTYFKERYGVGGTPTFLVIKNGELLGTLLGKTPAHNLIEFTRECLIRCCGVVAPVSEQYQSSHYGEYGSLSLKKQGCS